MENRARRSTPWLVLALLFISAGCSSVRTASVAPEQQVKNASESALTGQKPSTATEQILRLALLEELAESEPKLAIRSLLALYDRQWGPAGILGPATAAAELAIIEGRRLEDEAPEASGFYLAAAELALDAVLRATRGEVSVLSPRARFAADLYNHAVGRVVALLPETNAGLMPETRTFEGPLGSYAVALEGDFEPWNSRLFDLRPADEISVRGLRNRHRTHGLGAPLVSSRREIPERARPIQGFFESFENFYPVTAVARFSAETPRPDGRPGRHRDVNLDLHDPLIGEHVSIDGISVPLEADFTAPLAVLSEVVTPLTAQQAGTLRAGRYLDESGLYLLEPFREDKIPLVLVHGLQSSALTWLELTNDLLGDAELRRRFQIWAFYYPTGLPFSISAAILRQSLEQTLDHFDPERKVPHLHHMVMIGHSMGGLLVRSQAIDSGESIWNAVARRPFDEIDLPESDLYMLRNAYFPKPLPELRRAVFIATPHRGSMLADGALGRLASSLVKLPAILEEQFRRLQQANVLRDVEQEDTPDVFDSLSSESPILKAIEDLDIHVPFHTIVGDRIPTDDTVSDSFVTLESAQLDGAVSQKIITSGHNVHQTPEGIAEIRRILTEHLRAIDSEAMLRLCRGNEC